MSTSKAVDHPEHYGGEGNVYEVIEVIDAWALGRGGVVIGWRLLVQSWCLSASIPVLRLASAVIRSSGSPATVRIGAALLGLALRIDVIRAWVRLGDLDHARVHVRAELLRRWHEAMLRRAGRRAGLRGEVMSVRVSHPPTTPAEAAESVRRDEREALAMGATPERALEHAREHHGFTDWRTVARLARTGHVVAVELAARTVEWKDRRCRAGCVRAWSGEFVREIAGVWTPCPDCRGTGVTP